MNSKFNPNIILVRCLRPESIHFYEIGKEIDCESEYYYDIKFINGDIITLTKEELEFVNFIDFNKKQCWNEITEEQQLFIDLFEK